MMEESHSGGEVVLGHHGHHHGHEHDVHHPGAVGHHHRTHVATANGTVVGVQLLLPASASHTIPTQGMVEVEGVDEFGYRRRWLIGRLAVRVQGHLEGKPWRGFIASLVFYLSSCFTMTFALNFVHYRMPDPTKYPALPDFVHDLIPLQQPTVFGELLFHFTTILAIGSGLWYYRFNFWPYGTRYLMAWGIAWYIRVIALLATALPPTEKKFCRYDYPNYPLDFPHPIPNIWWNTLVGIASGGNGNIHCGDLLFSGHSVVIVMNWMLVMTYVRHNVLLTVLSTIITLGKLFLIIAERSHYTIDVLVSIYVSITVWQMTPEHIPYWLSAPFEAAGSLTRRVLILGRPRSEHIDDEQIDV